MSEPSSPWAIETMDADGAVKTTTLLGLARNRSECRVVVYRFKIFHFDRIGTDPFVAIQ